LTIVSMLHYIPHAGTCCTKCHSVALRPPLTELQSNAAGILENYLNIL